PAGRQEAEPATAASAAERKDPAGGPAASSREGAAADARRPDEADAPESGPQPAPTQSAIGELRAGKPN
ncbi:MAG TPA: hypothetical protein VGC06_29950, partial [Actinomycetes bacterium]